MEKNSKHTSEEIDLTDIFRLFQKMFHKVETFCLRVINFFIRNIIVVAVLVTIGAIAGYFIDKNNESSYRTEAVISTAYDNGKYLLESIEDIRGKSSEQLQELGIAKKNIRGIKVQPIFPKTASFSSEEKGYLEFLNENNIVEGEEFKNIFLDRAPRYEITLYHPKNADGGKILDNILTYIRHNDYYQQLSEAYQKHVGRQLQSNIYVEQQLDSLAANYAKEQTTNAMPYNSQENVIDFESFIAARNQLQKNTLALQEEQIAQQGFLNILKMSGAKPSDRFSLAGKRIYFFPFLLLIGFIGCVCAVRVFKKARALEKK